MERSLANGEQGTRDEIGFLLLHQGFADRFFPGTSVLQTRIRYALFVPWIYEGLIRLRRKGRDLDAVRREQLLQLARRLKTYGKEKTGVIGGDIIHQNRLSSQPPDLVYWSALKSWGMRLPHVDSTGDALRRIAERSKTAPTDDDEGDLDQLGNTDVFQVLADAPDGWDNPDSPLNFALLAKEKKYLRDKLQVVVRPDGELSLLAKLVDAGAVFNGSSKLTLPDGVERYADTSDREAIVVARKAASLAAIGRAVYGALVEHLREQEGVSTDRRFRDGLIESIRDYGIAAAGCDLEAADRLVPNMPREFREVLRQTCQYIQAGNPGEFLQLLPCYRASEVDRKSPRRARLAESAHAKERRFEWEPEGHRTRPLHYRWDVIYDMLTDLHG